VCAFLRGDDVLVVVALRSGDVSTRIEVPSGQWRDVLRGEQHTVSGPAAVDELLGRRCAVVLERLGRA
jgi:hypothetical protein